MSKSDLVTLTFLGGKTEAIQVRRGSFSVAYSCLSYIAVDDDRERVAHIPLHTLARFTIEEA
jgi:hypothetical protein